MKRNQGIRSELPTAKLREAYQDQRLVAAENDSDNGRLTLQG